MTKEKDYKKTIEKYKRELAQNKRELDRLRILFNITRNISKELVLEQLLMRIMDEAKNALNCDRCSIFSYDEINDELWARVAHGEKELRFASNLGIAGEVFHSNKVLNIPDAYSDTRFNPNIDKKTGYKTLNILTVPVRTMKGENIGVFQALNKYSGPFSKDDEELFLAISIISATQIENAQLYEEQRKTFDSFVETLAITIDARDPLTAGHSKRIALYADEVAQVLKLCNQERSVLRIAALLHDYGKIAVRDSVLTKDGTLSDEEFDHIKEHSFYTKSILEKINFSRQLKQVPSIASSHHEKIDGTGYPSGLRAEQIPRLGKILAVVDVFDALTSRRHYRDRMKFKQVMTLLSDGCGSQFDEFYVAAFKKIKIDRIIKILEIDNVTLLDKKDLKVLCQVDLQRLMTIEFDQKPEKIETNIIELFHYYYSREYLKGQC